MKRLLILLLVICLAVPVMRIEAADTFILNEYVKLCEKIGNEYNICPELLEAIIEAESSGKKYATNGKCKGLTQVYEGVHLELIRDLGITDIYDPESNIRVCAEILRSNYETCGDDLLLVLMCYNGVSHAKDKAAQGEYNAYARKVSARAYELEELHGKHDYKTYIKVKEAGNGIINGYRDWCVHRVSCFQDAISA